MTVEEYISALGSPQREVAEELRRTVKEAAPEAMGSIKWRMPVFDHDGPLCYIASSKQHVRFGFYRGDLLPDPDGVVEAGSGRGKHIRLQTPDAIPTAALLGLIKAAVLINAG